MAIWLVVLAILAGLAPSFGIIGIDIAIGLTCAFAAAGLVSVAATLKPDTAVQVTRLLRPWLIAILVAPVAWSLLQVIHLPFGFLSDPVWASASGALKQSLAGAISADIGATLIAASEACAVLAAGVVTIAVCSDRNSAAKMPYLLCALAVIVAGTQLYRDFGHHAVGGSRAGAVLAEAIGAILSCALLIGLRRRVSRRRPHANPRARSVIELTATTAAFILCTTSIALDGGIRALFIALLCAAVPVAVFVIRRWSLSAWAGFGILAAAAILIVAFFTLAPAEPDAFRLDAATSRSAAALMLSDAPALGHGAGTIRHLLPAYGVANEGPLPRAFTTATVIAIEMGHAFLWLYSALIILGSAWLVRSALTRNRGYIYAAGGAGILLAILLLSFVNPDVLDLPGSFLASSALAFAWGATPAKRKAVSTPLQAETSESPITLVEAPVSPVRDQPRHPTERTLRASFAGAAVLVALQACWLLVPGSLASKDLSVVISGGSSKDLDLAAVLATVRGDLWAKSGLARAAIAERADWPEGSARQIQVRLVNALRVSPYEGRVWLTLARLVDRFGWTAYDPAALLKMSYYTAASDAELLPATLKLALRLPATETDIELQDMIRRDIELVLLRFPRLRPALAKAFEGASAKGKTLAEQVIAQFDPVFLESLKRH